MGITLNGTSSYKMAVIATIAFAVVSIISVFCFGMVEATPIEKGAKTLLSEFATVIALAGVAIGIFNIVKGRMAMGIVVIVVAGILYVFCRNDSLFQWVGESIVGIFK